ncbi:MAG: hypothetical protein UV61_C0010G0017 [Candidatus Gottesmanbacteria bacterium GW2011_GWB1_43_11]|uniref:Yip1 domain-containing protein n=1 Tax=Candidatus Gottesmanbacteria bacterium GW2011_GWB1_43_11 TaxID=1618446 RepID=A0A0G1ETP6_9BACT|nr:MAG: hypothetical protein UV04_C0012G0017 [Candidatus Gottesmanbacteria bacterium GW2011_GWA2_42_16]KKS53533.1 MAG: hypothetical protein UV17_C0035G0018 [Candidatus Gottesmanbacteria bacterium GW2011_GWA1_42_26]KKS81207.1 MAG: hypothetical protein UV55_C0018G0017 [Candidatus Gottesmanbacteria bacterium GW2011_GWC1_43_10]KKS86466.1 MAG: hypothetical protein UV61_C0010G0017 [Candidatus Gottesmanbacteria bacterium GW2011_GWB1_43_11]OGG10111.1 MAG: hypothetical protein A2699_03670 [Candidatus Go
MGFLLRLLKLNTRFWRNVWGSIHAPYATYRSLVADDPEQLLVLVGLMAIYFFLVSPLKFRTFHPFLLTINASRLFTTALTTYLGVCFFFLSLGWVLGRKANLRGVMLAWGFTLVPTLTWFFTTSMFYVVLPPPRHETLPGIIFSLLFITFSISLLFWKGLLYYLTLRFALKLDLWRIIGVSIVFFPGLFLFSLWMYAWGIFRVPFV